MAGPALVVCVALALAGCSGNGTLNPDGPAGTPASTPVHTPARTPASTSGATPATTAGAWAAARLAAAGLNRADVAAGLLSRSVVWTGSGRLRVVKGSAKAPGRGKVTRVRVDVESGLKLDRRLFARFVLATLNDDRSWSHRGARTFARTDGRYDVRVVLASPATSARLCRPLVTFGKLSCGTGSTAVLSMYRWVKAIPEYRASPTGYRRYVVNHEVGHTLGRDHEYCAGKGKVAPVMMQQTKGLLGCRPNPWPFP